MIKRPPADVRKIISFDPETWVALHTMSLDSAKTLQELVDEAVRDLLVKHKRPALFKDALRASADAARRSKPANDVHPEGDDARPGKPRPRALSTRSSVRKGDRRKKPGRP